MIKKLLEKWKQEWWLKHAAEIAHQFQDREIHLKATLEAEIKQNIDLMELERDVLYTKIKSEIQKGKLLEEEVEFRQKSLNDRKLELIKADNDLKEQIKLIEAKAHPSSVWTEAFTMGVSKTWDLLLPLMQDNIDKIKSKANDDAIKIAIERLRASNKK